MDDDQLRRTADTRPGYATYPDTRPGSPCWWARHGDQPPTRRPAVKEAPMIPPNAAAWIRTVVLPQAKRDSQSDRTYCACQWGVCGHCQAGRHRECSVVAWGGAPRPSCDTHITDARGRVVGTAAVPHAELWRSGKPCRWVCPCGCTPIGADLPPAGPTPPIQLDLFAFAA